MSKEGFGLELPVTMTENGQEKVLPSKDGALPPWVTKPPPPKKIYKLPYIIFCCVLYVSINFYLNFTNKYLFDDLDFQYPVLIILLGTTASFFGSGVMVLWEQEKLQLRLIASNFKLIIVLGLGHSLTSGFENLALSRVSLSITQILKTIAPGFIMVYKAYTTKKPINPKLGGLLLIQIIGAGMAVYRNPEFDAIGILYSFLSMLAACVFTISSEKMLQESEMTPTQLTFFSSIPAIFVLISLMEGGELTRLNHVSSAGTFSLILVMTTAFMALFYSISQFMVVQATSGLYFTVIGNFKTALLVVSAILFLHETLTPLNGVGVVIGIAGFIAYSWVKFRTGDPNA
uniref:Sugar phosphate transporter domain-containing protein n=1 Tax=Paramoeba aestuarina TaxID=180227 RepID=A0A7S4NV26_9EUKA|mmetsp:Transcript_29437/g.45526  ORF Transcript_29437/g.45526 Transcript_29437/m.45526 type:complete len:345 (+) Transcript_29437:24-1058(+)